MTPALPVTDVAPDGNGLFMLQQAEGATQLTIVLNWPPGVVTQRR